MRYIYIYSIVSRASSPKIESQGRKGRLNTCPVPRWNDLAWTSFTTGTTVVLIGPLCKGDSVGRRSQQKNMLRWRRKERRCGSRCIGRLANHRRCWLRSQLSIARVSPGEGEGTNIVELRTPAMPIVVVSIYYACVRPPRTRACVLNHV